MTGYISKFAKLYTAFPRLASSPRTLLPHTSTNPATTKLPPHLAYSFTSGNLSYSLSLSVTLASNTSANATPFTSAMSSISTTPSLKTRRVPNFPGWTLTGTHPNARVACLFQATSRKSSPAQTTCNPPIPNYLLNSILPSPTSP